MADSKGINERDGIVARSRVWLAGWGLLTAWGLVSLSLDVPAIPGGGAFANAFTCLASIVACIAFYVVVGKTGKTGAGSPSYLQSKNKTENRPLSYRSPAWIAALVMLVCSVANQLVQKVWASDVVPLVLQAVSSVAYIVLMYQWFCAYVASDPQDIETGAIAATAVCALCCVVCHVLPELAIIALWALLPAASVACLVRVGGEPPEECEADSATANSTENPVGIPAATSAGISAGPAPESSVPLSAPSASARTGWVVSLVGIALCDFVMTMPTNLASMVAWNGIEDASRLGNIAGLVLAAILIFWYVGSARKIALQSLFKLLYPLAALGLLGVAIPAGPATVIGIGLVSAGQWALYVFVWIFAAESARTNVSSRWVFVSSRVAFDVGGLAGALLALGIVAAIGAQVCSQALPYILFATLAIFMIATVLLPSPGDIADTSGELPAPAATPTNAVALHDAQAAQMASAYKLSAREAQILAYLLRGYSTAAIRNELTIAKGTVDTHIQRIYQKCDVHSRQELVELVESMERG